jgi:hypothetical protein
MKTLKNFCAPCPQPEDNNMNMLKLTGIILCLFSTALEARDQVPREKKSALSPLEYNTIDQTVMSDTRQYAPNLKGLREYMDLEVASGSRDYDRLNSRLQDLERQDAFAFRASLVPVGLGVGSLLVGSLLRQDEEPTDPRLKSVHDTGGRLMLYGLGGICLGFIVNSILEPGDKEIREFIQLHNGKASQTSSRSGPGSKMSVHLFSENTLVSMSYKF